MTFETCSTLAQIFPIFLIGLVIESARVDSKLRRMFFFRNVIVIAGMTAGLMGFVVALVGLQFEGLAAAQAVVVWLFFGLAVACFVFEMIAILATQEDSDEAAAAIPVNDERDLLEWLQR